MIQRNNGKVEVVVAGGSLPGSELSTEIFSVTDNRWRTGPNLPQAIIYGVSVQFANTLVILGNIELVLEYRNLVLTNETLFRDNNIAFVCIFRRPSDGWGDEGHGHNFHVRSRERALEEERQKIGGP